MRVSPYRTRTHLFVCANRRAEADPLGPGCADAGERVFAELKRTTRFTQAWVSKTHCLGLCPKRGCAVALHDEGTLQYLVEVDETDVPQILNAAR